MITINEPHNDSKVMDKYKLLLTNIAWLYEKHNAGYSESFNIFLVLRGESDEVNLHSRFLVALLDHKTPDFEQRFNLQEFLESVAKVPNFELGNVSVEREKHQVDILIRNPSQAVVIENKIWAGDQPQQLQRYHKELTRQGYEVHLRYLTPFGNNPSKDSVEDLEHKTIAYTDVRFQKWLRSCQQRACGEPWLREAVAQYLSVIRKLTGSDMKHAYLKDLVDLLREENHLLLAHDLKRAYDESWAQCIEELFSEISTNLNDYVQKHFNATTRFVSEGDIRRVVSGAKGAYFKLYLNLDDHFSFAVNASAGELWFCVECNEEEHREIFQKIQEILPYGHKPYPGTPWWTWSKVLTMDMRYPGQDDIAKLIDEGKRREIIKRIEAEVRNNLTTLRNANLIQ